MYQPEVKLQFIQRYCSPHKGWKVYVDIDASEEGRTGGERKSPESRATQKRMAAESKQARAELTKLDVKVGGPRADWFEEHGLPEIKGDRDIVAFNPASKICLIAEVEGESTGQPEQKLYKAIGQIIMATSCEEPKGWVMKFALVVHGKGIAEQLHRATSLKRLGISALSLSASADDDEWLFGREI